MKSFTPKSHRELSGMLLPPFHKKMVALAMWLMTRLSQVVVTSAWREGDKGIGGTWPCRHLDIRSWIYEDGAKVADDINDHWEYDKSRLKYKCALYHAYCPKCKQNHKYAYQEHCQSCGTKIKYHWHIHLQVHNNTKYLGG